MEDLFRTLKMTNASQSSVTPRIVFTFQTKKYARVP